MTNYLDYAELVQLQKPKFIELTLQTGKVFIEIHKIVGFERVDESKITRILYGEARYWSVEETPEQILRLIKNAWREQ